jgi:putative ABC transport system permease protein
LVDREFNLSTQPKQPPHNRSPGALDRPNEAGAISVEQGLAETLGLKLGDTLRFDVAGTAGRGRITSPAQGRLGLDAGQLLRDVPDWPRWPMCR